MLRIESISKTFYPGTVNERRALDRLSLILPDGDFAAIVGSNGAGKSTLLDLLAGIARPSAGEVSVCGQAIASMSRRQIARHIAYVGQQQTVPHLTVYDEVLLGRRPHVGWGLTDHDREVAARAIARLGFEGYSRRYCAIIV